ncbi:MAG: hypothetical protein J1F35_01450 [Erysipelotrichales bacterium]|nr:hypothetical protein [Erysipelotrichales bacterium]
MKKALKIAITIILLIILISLLLFSTKEYVDEVKDTLENTKVVKRYNNKTKEVEKVYNEDETKELIKQLDYSKWTETKELNNDEVIYTLKLYEDEDSENDASIDIVVNYEFVIVKINGYEDKLYQTNHNLKSMFKKR